MSTTLTAGTAGADGNTEVIHNPRGRGRKPDLTPNKKFTPTLVIDNGDGTGLYKVSWNDENGKRHAITETRTLAKAGGRAASTDPNSVYSVKQTRIEGTGNIRLSVPFNDSEGTRQMSAYIMSVSKKGKVTFTETEVTASDYGKAAPAADADAGTDATGADTGTGDANASSN